MTIFNFLTLLGSLSLFLFGMSVMGTALEKRAGRVLEGHSGEADEREIFRASDGACRYGGHSVILGYDGHGRGLCQFGAFEPQAVHSCYHGREHRHDRDGVAAVAVRHQRRQLFVQLLKPSSFTPVLAVIGIILYLTAKGKKKDTGLILLGFATLMFGMESLSGSVSGLRDDPNFTKFFLLFSNPILGVLAGAILTGIVQSSSASVGILQALSSTGAVSYGAAIPLSWDRTSARA